MDTQIEFETYNLMWCSQTAPQVPKILHNQSRQLAKISNKIAGDIPAIQTAYENRGVSNRDINPRCRIQIRSVPKRGTMLSFPEYQLAQRRFQLLYTMAESCIAISAQ